MESNYYQEYEYISFFARAEFEAVMYMASFIEPWAKKHKNQGLKLKESETKQEWKIGKKTMKKIKLKKK